MVNVRCDHSTINGRISIMVHTAWCIWHFYSLGMYFFRRKLGIYLRYWHCAPSESTFERKHLYLAILESTEIRYTPFPSCGSSTESIRISLASQSASQKVCTLLYFPYELQLTAHTTAPPWTRVQPAPQWPINSCHPSRTDIISKQQKSLLKRKKLQSSCTLAS